MEIKLSTQKILSMLIIMLPLLLVVIITTMDLLIVLKFMNVLSKSKMIGEMITVQIMVMLTVIQFVIQLTNVQVLMIVNNLLTTLKNPSNISIPTVMVNSILVIISSMNTYPSWSKIVISLIKTVLSVDMNSSNVLWWSKINGD